MNIYHILSTTLQLPSLMFAIVKIPAKLGAAILGRNYIIGPGGGSGLHNCARGISLMRGFGPGLHNVYRYFYLCDSPSPKEPRVPLAMFAYIPH